VEGVPDGRRTPDRLVKDHGGGGGASVAVGVGRPTLEATPPAASNFRADEEGRSRIRLAGSGGASRPDGVCGLLSGADDLEWGLRAFD